MQSSKKSDWKPLRPAALIVLCLILTTTLAPRADGGTMDNELFNEYRQKNPTKIEFIEKYKKALDALDHGKPKTAIRIFSELTREDPQCAGAWTSMGTACMWTEEYEKGVQCTTKAIALRPKDDDVYRRRALHYIALLKYKEAVGDLTQAKKIKATDSLTLRLRADCLTAMKRYDEALEDINARLKIEPRSEEALHQKALLNETKGDFKGAVAVYDLLFKYYPDDDHVLVSRGSCKMKLNDYKGAVNDFTAAIKMGSEEPQFVLNQRATAYEKLGMKDMAAKDRAAARR